jgi:hypothetical protein
LDLQKCNGFLAAMALANSEPSDCCAEFFLTLLPPAKDLKGALELYFENYVREANAVLRDGRSAEDWLVDTLAIDAVRKLLSSVCEKWFFSSDHMRASPTGTHRANLISSFLDNLAITVGSGMMHRVYITPPCWYAIDWDEFVFENEEQRFLLHFSHSD